MMATGTCGRTNCAVSLPAMHKQREGKQDNNNNNNNKKKKKNL
jgi:hypothetical protein